MLDDDVVSHNNDNRKNHLDTRSTFTNDKTMAQNMQTRRILVSSHFIFLFSQVHNIFLA